MHTKSWVFEGTGDIEDDANFDESSISLCSSASPTHSAAAGTATAQNHQQQVAQTSCSTSKRRFSRLSDANSERFTQQLTSFSRCATPSPVPRSGQITPSIVPFSEYLEPKAQRLTIVDFISAAPKLKKVTVDTSCSSQGPASLTTEANDSPYASLLAELEQSLQEKKMNSSFSPDNTSLTTSTDKFCSSSKSSSKDLEFSKELEAALQLIQELETPSEGPLEHMLSPTQNAQIHRSDSEKTLSAAVSLPSPEALPISNGSVPSSTITSKLTIDVQSPHNGKHILSVLCNEPNSQSTSGYSSPNSSNLNSVKEFDSSETVEQPPSIAYCQSKLSSSGGHHISTTLIKTLDINQFRQIDESTCCNPIALTSSKSNSANKSFLLFKKRSKLMPQPEFQNRIFKSECLAYLTEEELIERHQLNRNLIRVRH